MSEEKSLGFVPVKSAVCNFNNEVFNAPSPMTELAKTLELSKVKIARRKLSLSSDASSPTPERLNTLAEVSNSPFVNSPLAECPDMDSPIIEYMRTKNADIMKRNCTSRSFSSPAVPSEKLARKIKRKLDSLIRDRSQRKRRFSSPRQLDDEAEEENEDDFTRHQKCSKKYECPMENDILSDICPKDMKNYFQIIQRKPLAPLTLFNNSFTSPFKPVTSSERKDEVPTPKEENHSDLSLCEMDDRVPDIAEGFKIKKPRSYAGRPHSAPTVKSIFQNQRYREATDDDGFFGDILKDEENNMSPSCPSTFSLLVDAPIVKNEFAEEDKENYVPVKNNHVFEKPSGIPLKHRSISCSVKRTGESPKRVGKKLKTKCGRSHSFFEGNPALVPIPLVADNLKGMPSPRTLQRSQSFDLHNVKSAQMDVTQVDMDDKSLLGDKSREYLLPTTHSKHPDLKGINHDTMADILNGRYKDHIEEYLIIDCRYPYEFEGGHIKGALNIHDKQSMVEFFLKNPRPPPPDGKRRIVIFHCEFSSKRGPSMSRFLRNKDRDIHQNYYPRLYYPELYLLEGGYKEFYAHKKTYCEPQGYREMNDADYHQELRLFSKRSKSWSEDTNVRNRTSLRF